MLLHALIATAGLTALGLGFVQVSRRGEARAQRQAHRPVEVATDGYVSSRQCRACHPQQHESWDHSYHGSMTRPATPEHVFGDFDDVELKHGDQRFELRREGERFVMRALPPDDDERVTATGVPRVVHLPPGDHELALVTGSHHMQVYWYDTGEGRQLGQVPFAYLTEQQRWIPRRMAFLRPPTKFRPAETGRWNATCIHCHTTHGQPRADAATRSFDTRAAEFGIGCEACHGPGRRHVARHTSPLSRYAKHLGGDDDAPDETIVNPRRLDHERSSQICSQCHAIWQVDADARGNWNTRGSDYRPGGDPTESMWLFAPSRADADERVAAVVEGHPSYTAGQFWPDGQARVSGREFNGMADSPCYERGEMACSSCHEMHQRPDDPRPHAQWADDQLSVGMDGDRACLQCHAEIGGALAQHTHHAESSHGSRCYNCHMPHTSYGLLKAIRSHEITSPDVATELRTGRPNACNACHLDRSLGWTAQQLQYWYDVPPPELTDDQRELSAAVGTALTGDAAQRALMAWAMGWRPAREASGGAWMAPFLGILMDDPYDAVRFIAERSLRSHPGFEKLDYDFVRAPHAREPVAGRIAAMAPPPRRAPPAVPVDARGELDREVVSRLQARRDNRPVNLLE